MTTSSTPESCRVIWSPEAELDRRPLTAASLEGYGPNARMGGLNVAYQTGALGISVAQADEDIGDR